MASDTLTRLDEKLDTVLAELASIKAAIALGGKAAPAQSPREWRSPFPEIAEDADLDRQGGDPLVKADPKGWNGPTQVGRRYSALSAPYLELLIGRLEWVLGKCIGDGATAMNGQPLAPLKAHDLSLARAWLRRKRQQEQSRTPNSVQFMEIPDDPEF